MSTSLTHQQHQHTHSTTSSSVLSRSGASHQVEQRTSIRTYYSQADLSMVTAVRPSSPLSLASEAATAAASQSYVSVRNGDGIYEDAGYYEAAGGHVVDRVRSPSLPPLGRLNRSGGR